MNIKDPATLAMIVSVGPMILTAVNIYVTIYFSNKKINTELISQNRIKWIEEVRAHLVNLSKENLRLSIDISKNPKTIPDSAVEAYFTEFSNLKLFFPYNPFDKKDLGFHLTNEMLIKKGDIASLDLETIETTEIKNGKFIKSMLEEDNTKIKDIKINRFIVSISSFFHNWVVRKDDDPNYDGYIELEMIHNYTNDLIKIISLYLKIEWDKAKQGQ